MKTSLFPLAARRRPGRVLAVLAALAVLPMGAAPAGAGANDPLPSSTPIRIDGGGYGHGHGMSQHGARGQAEAGRSWQTIIKTYYSGVSLVNRGSSETIRVQMFSAGSVVVDGSTYSDGAQYPFTASWVGGGTIGSSSDSLPFMRARMSSGTMIVEAGSSASGPWTQLASGAGPARFTSSSALIAYRESDGEVRYVRGFVETMKKTSSSLHVINQLTMNDYLYGVVPREMPALWHPEAVKAQSVAARTYSAYKKDHAPSSQGYDICSTTSCQVYGGYGYRKTAGSSMTFLEHSAARSAVDATSGMVAAIGGKPIFSEFSSSSGGHTAPGSAPYLAPIDDPWDAQTGNPHHRWEAALTAGEINKKWPEIGSLVTFKVTERDGHGPWGGRVNRLELTGTKATKTVTGATFRFAFSWSSSSNPDGIRSELFRIFVPPFVDDEGSVHEANIRAIWSDGITGGCNPEGDRYCPFDPVTRGQMAAFIKRTLNLPAGSGNSFDDDDGHLFEASIEAIAAAGIAGGCGERRFCPNRAVNRAEMATLLVKAFDFPPAVQDYFTDDEESVHEPNINALAQAGVTGGCREGRYCPGYAVTRAEMATFLERSRNA